MANLSCNTMKEQVAVFAAAMKKNNPQYRSVNSLKFPSLCKSNFSNSFVMSRFTRQQTLAEQLGKQRINQRVAHSNSESPFPRHLSGMKIEVYDESQSLSIKENEKIHESLKTTKININAGKKNLSSLSCTDIIETCNQGKKNFLSINETAEGFNPADKILTSFSFNDPIENSITKSSSIDSSPDTFPELALKVSRAYDAKYYSEKGRKLAALSNKQNFEDPFFFGNMAKNACFSPFAAIIEGNSEGSNAYPYCTKFLKSGTKSVVKRTIKRSVSNKKNCKCPSKFDIPEELDFNQTIIPKHNEIKLKIPFLTRLLFYPQRVTCYYNLIIINFEGTFSSINSCNHIQKGVWKNLKKLSMHFQIILIAPLSSYIRDKLLQIFEKKKIRLSGVYTTISLKKQSCELEKLQNYTQIYQDFDCENPTKNCLILTNHRVFDEVAANFLVFNGKGLRMKINMEKAPVACLEQPCNPLTVLLPSVELGVKSEFFTKIVNSLEGPMNEDRDYFAAFDFLSHFKLSEFNIFATSAIQNFLLETVIGNFAKINPESDEATYYQKGCLLYCKLHERLYIKEQTLPLNYFLYES